MTAQQLKTPYFKWRCKASSFRKIPTMSLQAYCSSVSKPKTGAYQGRQNQKDKKSSEIFRGATHNLPYAYCEQIGKEIRDISDEIPFEIPESWEWVRCSVLGAIIRGSGIKRTETVDSGLPCVRYGELYTTYNISFTKTISFIPKELFEQCKQISYGDVISH